MLGLRLVQVDGKNFYTEQGILSLETGATASIQVLIDYIGTDKITHCNALVTNCTAVGSWCQYIRRLGGEAFNGPFGGRAGLFEDKCLTSTPSLCSRQVTTRLVVSVLKSTIARLKAGGILEIDGDDIVYSTDTYYVCLLVNGTFRHQGRDPAVSIQMRSAPPWPIWV